MKFIQDAISRNDAIIYGVNDKNIQTKIVFLNSLETNKQHLSNKHPSILY